MTAASEVTGDSTDLPLVSICIRNYNYGRFLAEAIDSSLNQSYPRTEIIVVDDGSTDETPDVLARYEHLVEVIRQSNAGQFHAATTALQAARGDLILFQDADDRLHSGTAARVVRAFAAHPDAGRVQWRMAVMDEDGSPTGATFPQSNWIVPDGDLADEVLRRRTYVWPPTSGLAFRRSAVELVLRCLEPGHSFVDVDLPLAQATPLLGPVVNLSGTGCDYRHHQSAHSSQIRKDPIVFFHDRIDEVLEGQRMQVRVGEEVGRHVDPDPCAALDWAFAGYRLASLRLEPGSHPIPDDTVLRVAAHGIRSVATQPHYTLEARVKRVVWFTGTALAPRPVAKWLIAKAFLDPPRADQVNERAARAAEPARTPHRG